MSSLLKQVLPTRTRSIRQPARSRALRWLLPLILVIVVVTGFQVANGIFWLILANEPVLYVPWAKAGEMNEERDFPTATRLQSGEVLVAGGSKGGSPTVPLASTEVYDPEAKLWSTAASLGTARGQHTANLLASGQVLVAGGFDESGNRLASAEIYDVTAGKWTPTGSMVTGREGHTATLLADGRVLAAGGVDQTGSLTASAEVYDPVMAKWTATGNMIAGRKGHTATLLPDGTVLVAGGTDESGIPLASVELYDPISKMWSAADSLSSERGGHTATTLPDGKVLIVGGVDDSGAPAGSAEMYDPLTGNWGSAGALGFARSEHTATLLSSGQVLIVGGQPGEDQDCNVCDKGSLHIPTELHDPTSGTWKVESRLSAVSHTATLLEDGQLLVAGGYVGAGDETTGGYYPLLFTRTSGTWTVQNGSNHNSPLVAEAASNLSNARAAHTATYLDGAKVLIAGGIGESSLVATSEVFDLDSGTWSPSGDLNKPRWDHTATRLPSGLVLITGGAGEGSGGVESLASAEIYDPETGEWTITGSMNEAREGHRAILLPSGLVLVSGGFNELGILSSAELYNPATKMWTSTGSMSLPRADHGATLLNDGQVLATGGFSPDGPDYISLKTAETYNPDTGTCTPTGSMAGGRLSHSATQLQNGEVLVAGGVDLKPDPGTIVDSAELYDPQTGTWRSTGALDTERVDHTATMMPDGQVIVVGGESDCCFENSAELYDPSTGNWTKTSSMHGPGRVAHTATLLYDFRVIVVGGADYDNMVLDDVEIFNTDFQDFHLALGDFLQQSPARERYYGHFMDHASEINDRLLTDLGFMGRRCGGRDLVGAQCASLARAGKRRQRASPKNNWIAWRGFFDNLISEAGPGLEQAMLDEAERLPHYDEFVGKTVLEARDTVYEGLSEEESKTYTITPTAGPNGKIDPSTPQTVNEGKSISFC